MSCSSLKKLVGAVSHIAVCGMLLAAMPAPASAEETEEGVCRTFAVFVNSLDQAPDLQSEQSLGLVVAPAAPKQTDTIYFDAYDCDEELSSSIWENATLWGQQDVMHITKDGAKSYGNVYWLLTPKTPEPPPMGATTFRGTDSPLILNPETFYYEEDVTGTGYQIRCPSNGPGGAGLLLVVTAVFSR